MPAAADHTNQPTNQAEITKKVLVIDNSPEVRQQLAKVLQGVAQVQVSFNQKQAIQQINTMKFALIVLDMTSPSLGGIDILQIIDALHPSTPVIVTANPSEANDPNWARDVFLAGAFASLEKPFTAKHLAEKIAAALSLDDNTALYNRARALGGNGKEIGTAGNILREVGRRPRR